MKKTLLFSLSLVFAPR
uniref:BabB n=1 Tax=Helicobacter pylori TaxID=210 RepID=A0A0N9EJL5_HELPX|nr:BabB [Helicobacter pylori]ALF45061.1 BabB [Helicobacter pylori]ALF45066.1 BabB [Helicobacter pylori]